MEQMTAAADELAFSGRCIQLRRLASGVAEMCFDRQGDAVNKFDARALDELREAASKLTLMAPRGLVVSSAKAAFIVGADITEFHRLFMKAETEIAAWLADVNGIFSAIEDLPFPTVTAINGFALGGGFEMALATDYRVMSTGAKVGFPEVKLGIIPGFGGIVRFPRLVGADNAIEWIAAGMHNDADAALKVGAVDAVVESDQLRAAALRMLELADAGSFDWTARRAQKKARLMLDPIEAAMTFQTALGFVGAKAGKHYPAPLRAVTCIQQGAGKERDGALALACRDFAALARTSVADALVGIFLNDQVIKRKAKAYGKAGRRVTRAAVVGAGIMGGGISYQNARKGTPVVMKDIADKALELGISEANKLLSREVERGRLTPDQAGHILGTIRPTLNYGDFRTVDLVVEAVVESAKVKKAVLAEVEGEVGPDTILATNTSSISIDELASVLKRPENFLGMHFFNPVHRMPLVEVVYGEKTSRQAIATVAAHAAALGKSPIVVRNCPGFLVNRVLFPYFAGWARLLRDGADFVAVDKIMHDFGWPMGPAYLQDVIGVDTSHHVEDVLAKGYPDRMAKTFRDAIDVMYEAKRLGQKSGAGFYRYEPDDHGKPKKVFDPETYELLAPVQPDGRHDYAAEEVIDRLMLPMIIETARCLDEKVVETAAEADVGMVCGIGFPPFRGGALRYADAVGMHAILDKCARYASLGPLYQPTASMKAMAASGSLYFPR